MAVTASFLPATGVLTVFGDSLNNTITLSRNAAGTILVNGGAVQIKGGTATVANTKLIQGFGQAGEQPTTRKRFKGDQTEAEDVRTPIDQVRFLPRLLWTHVTRCAGGTW